VRYGADENRILNGISLPSTTLDDEEVKGIEDGVNRICIMYALAFRPIEVTKH